MVGKEIEILDEVEIEETIKRYEELKPIVSEYNKLDKKWKEAVKEKEKVMVGNYLITGKWIERKGHVVEDGKFWKSTILIRPDKTVVKDEG
jgi:hypothetical protein